MDFMRQSGAWPGVASSLALRRNAGRRRSRTAPAALGDWWVVAATGGGSAGGGCRRGAAECAVLERRLLLSATGGWWQRLVAARAVERHSADTVLYLSPLAIVSYRVRQLLMITGAGLLAACAGHHPATGASPARVMRAGSGDSLAAVIRQRVAAVPGAAAGIYYRAVD